jgi:glycosyltransferase involved in cell wall biosynthesis
VVGDEAVASTRYRILAHLPALRAAGYDPEITFQKPRPASRLLRSPLRLLDEIRDLRQAADSDLLLIHRRCYPGMLAPLLRRKNRPMVFDIDDAIDLPSPSEPNSKIARARYRRNFDTTIAAADLVLCGNPVLAERVGKKKRKVILPTAVDCTRFHPDAIKGVDHPTAGWVGHSSNLAYLEAITGPLREIAWRHPGFKLIVVADRRPRLEGVPVEYRPWTFENEVECFSGIGIGLMPLDDSEWTRAKCAFKLLQYMAFAIPSLASPVGMNREVIENGRNGLLAITDEDWVNNLDELISRPAKRREIGCAGRETVEKSFDLPVVSARLLKALNWVMSSRDRADKLS